MSQRLDNGCSQYQKKEGKEDIKEDIKVSLNDMCHDFHGQVHVDGENALLNGDQSMIYRNYFSYDKFFGNDGGGIMGAVYDVPVLNYDIKPPSANNNSQNSSKNNSISSIISRNNTQNQENLQEISGFQLTKRRKAIRVNPECNSEIEIQINRSVSPNQSNTHLRGKNITIQSSKQILNNNRINESLQTQQSHQHKQVPIQINGISLINNSSLNNNHNMNLSNLNGANNQTFVNKLKNPLSKQILQQYYSPRKNSKIEESFSVQKDPHLQVHVKKIGNGLDATSSQVYIVTKNGVIGSQKNTDIDDIIIGRQQSTQTHQNNEIKPNDIILPATDRAISRIHCQIISQYGFKRDIQIPEYFLEFLKGTRRKNNPIRQLQLLVLKYIWNFSRPPFQFYIVDIGSVFGTYLRVQSNQSHKIMQGEIFLVGADTFFCIKDLAKGFNEYHSLEFKEREEADRAFLLYMSQQKLEGTKISGLTSQETDFVNQIIDQKKRNEEDVVDAICIQVTSSMSNSLMRPFIKIEPKMHSGNPFTSHIFIPNFQNQSNQYQIGRAQDCDVVINHKTLSRKQCRIYFQQNAWYLADGEATRESANGTWISLTDIYEKEVRQESDPKLIEDGSEIKISDSILQIEMCNLNFQTNLIPRSIN